MRKIWNYELQPEGKQMIYMPSGSRPLGIMSKGGLPFLNVLVDDTKDPVQRFFRIVTTDEDFNPDFMDYIGCLRLGGPVVPETDNTEDERHWYTMHVLEILVPGDDPLDERKTYKEDLKDLKREL